MRYIPVLAATALLASVTTVAVAQSYPTRDRNGGVIDWLDRLTRDTGNEPLNCDMTKRLDRDGDVVWFRMTCESYRRRR